MCRILLLIDQSPIKSCILDPLPACLLYLDRLTPVITKVINVSPSSASIPDLFKHAVVKPLLNKQRNKNKQTKEPSASRTTAPPLLFLSTLLEKVVLSQLKYHPASNCLFDTSQSAWKKKKIIPPKLLCLMSQTDFLWTLTEKLFLFFLC